MLKKLLSTNVNEFININLSLLLLRVSAGALIFTHGLPKLMKVFAGDFAFGDPIGLGPEVSLILSAFAEGICGLLLIFGVGTRFVSIALIINMATAFFIAHSADPFNVKELSLLYLIMFVVLLFTGGGSYSADNKLSK